MHVSSMENMQRCIKWYLPERPLKVIDTGSLDVNGSYRSLFPDGTNYIGLDLEAGKGVDVILEDPYKLPFEDDSIDVVVSGQMLEHCPHFWRVFEEIKRVLRPEGLAFVIAPSAGHIHRYPVDCYRFHPDAYRAMADWSGLRLVHCWRDPRGPWRDLVGVFQKGGKLKKRTSPPPASFIALKHPPHEDPNVEQQFGQKPYLDVLKDIHAIKQPRQYLEIGIQTGKSLALASCPAIGIDPSPHLQHEIASLDLYECTSDDFFFFHAQDTIETPIDMAFIDGMHLSDFVYRDFMYLEKFMADDGLIILDDVLPNHPFQARRNRITRTWTGDVWRMTTILKSLRPDLKLTFLDTHPSGLLVIQNLKPKNRKLYKEYNHAIRKLLLKEPVPPKRILNRTFAQEPNRKFLESLINGERQRPSDQTK